MDESSIAHKSHQIVSVSTHDERGGLESFRGRAGADLGGSNTKFGTSGHLVEKRGLEADTELQLKIRRWLHLPESVVRIV